MTSETILRPKASMSNALVANVRLVAMGMLVLGVGGSYVAQANTALELLQTDDALSVGHETRFDDFDAQAYDDIDAWVDEDAFVELQDDEATSENDSNDVDSNDVDSNDVESNDVDEPDASNITDDSNPTDDITDANASFANPNFDSDESLENNTTVLNTEDTELSLAVSDVPLNAISPQTLQRFVEVIDVIRREYVTTVSDEVLFQHAINGMLSELDIHSNYLTKEAFYNLREFTEGEIGQVGIEVTYQPVHSAWIVSAVEPKTSAAAMGIRVGDEVLSVKGIALDKNTRTTELYQWMSGIAGSQVEVRIKNQAGETKNLMLQRDLPQTNPLTIYVKKGVAVVKLPVFQNTSKSQLLQGLKKVEEPVYAIVLDVRNNPGGVLSAATDIASLFLPNKTLIKVQNRVNPGQSIASNGVPYLQKVPVVVLQNRYSASASEVLASALQENGKLVAGEMSFGKGTVQEVMPLETGGALKLTVAEYRSITDKKIDGVGITPNLTFAPNEDWVDKIVELTWQHAKRNHTQPVDLELLLLEHTKLSLEDY